MIKILLAAMLLAGCGLAFGLGFSHYYHKSKNLEVELAVNQKKLAALQNGAQACLEREAASLVDALEREDILREIKNDFVDNATQYKIIERINRPFH